MTVIVPTNLIQKVPQRMTAYRTKFLRTLAEVKQGSSNKRQLFSLCCVGRRCNISPAIFELLCKERTSYFKGGIKGLV